MAVTGDKGMHDWVADYDGEGDDGDKRCQRQRSGNDGCKGRRWRQRQTTTVVDDDGGG
jgi:hypothetical protein